MESNPLVEFMCRTWNKTEKVSEVVFVFRVQPNNLVVKSVFGN